MKTAIEEKLERVERWYQEAVIDIQTWSKLCADQRKQLREVIDYCRPHLYMMWAANIVGILLKCDFKDAAAMLEKFDADNRVVKL